MVSCLFWTPGSSFTPNPHPATVGLAERVSAWDFIGTVSWLGRPPPWWKAQVRSATWRTRHEWLEAVASVADGDHLFLVPGDAPFLREDLCREIWTRHLDTRADYTFSDGYPLGLAGEVVRCQALAAMVQASEDDGSPPDREGIFSAILKDVNAFDIETVLSPVDTRQFRLGFFDEGPAATLLLHRWADRASLALDAFLEAIQADRVSQRTLPAYWKLQLTRRTLQTPVYSLPPADGATLGAADTASVVRRVGAWMGGTVLMPGFWNEPSLFGDWALLEEAASNVGFSWVIETSGLGWSGAAWEVLGHRPEAVTWILELDASDPALYLDIRGDGFEEAWETARQLHARFPGRVYLQAVRFDQNEHHVGEFYQKAKALTGKVIIQHYNSLAGRLPARGTLDLSPWKRHPCWHLQRGLHSLADGTAVPCHQFPHAEHAWGNLLHNNPAEVWELGRAWMVAHQQETYPKDCVDCDEYYHFTF